MNPCLEKLSGWSEADVEGRDWFEIFVPHGSPEGSGELFRLALAGTRPREHFHPILLKTGEERMIDWSFAALTDSGGARTGLVCTGTDVTDRRRLEREIIGAVEEERRRVSRELHAPWRKRPVAEDVSLLRAFRPRAPRSSPGILTSSATGRSERSLPPWQIA